MTQQYDDILASYTDQLKRQGFDLLEQIGSGLSGRVLKADQPSLERKVAVKFFDNEIARKDPNLRKRFLREAKLLARLQHPGIPYVLTTGIVPDGDIPYTVIDARSDLYSVGVVLLEMLMGTPKFAFDHLDTLLVKASSQLKRIWT